MGSELPHPAGSAASSSSDEAKASGSTDIEPSFHIEMMALDTKSNSIAVLASGAHCGRFDLTSGKLLSAATLRVPPPSDHKAQTKGLFLQALRWSSSARWLYATDFYTSGRAVSIFDPLSGYVVASASATRCASAMDVTEDGRIVCLSALGDPGGAWRVSIFAVAHDWHSDTPPTLSLTDSWPFPHTYAVSTLHCASVAADGANNCIYVLARPFRQLLRICKLDFKGNLMAEWLLESDLAFLPRRLSLLRHNGLVAVVLTRSRKEDDTPFMRIYRPDGCLVREFELPDCASPSDVASDATGRIYVLDSELDAVLVYK